MTIKKKAYAALSKDKKIWKRSASGGAFSEICKAWGDSETLFAGAAWDKLSVHHICIYNYNDIIKLCKSKYVASNLENTFDEIKEHLESGKKAVFCGTPCQVAGLKSFLGKEYNNLLLIDLICHGVGSPSVFSTCIKILEEQFNDEIMSYTFRSKGSTYEMDYIQKLQMKKRVLKYVMINIFSCF